jgi:lysozyme
MSNQQCVTRTGTRSLACAAALVLGLQAVPASPQVSTSPGPTPEPVSRNVQTQGIDVSHDQGAIDWSRVAAAGKQFAFVKATQGIGESDPDFASNWQGAKAVGLVRGAYHYFQPGDDPVEQAKHFLSVVTLETGDLPPALDVEEQGSLTDRELIRDIRRWLQVVQHRTGMAPIVYSGAYFWDGLDTGAFARFPLWVADYNSAAPRIPTGWKTWKFWQYSGAGTVSGIAAPVDLDLVQGSLEGLRKKH